MKSVFIVVALLSAAFFIGMAAMLASPGKNTPAQTPVTREFTLEGISGVPSGTATASILGSITITGIIPEGSTINIEAKQYGTQQFSTILQNLPAKSTQTFSYTKATSGTTYDMKVTLLDSLSKVLGISQILTISAPSLNVEFKLNSVVPTVTSTPNTVPTFSTSQTTTTSSSVAPTALPTSSLTSLSGTINFRGAAPVNSRIVILQKPANAASYQVASDNINPVNGSAWYWDYSASGNSYTVIAVLKQKNANGSDTDISISAPVTVTAPATTVVLTINSSYTLPKPAGTITVTCSTYNSGPNQNTWNVTVNFPVYTDAKSYWLQIGTTDAGSDIVNTSGASISTSAVFKNNTTYFARYAYAGVADVDTGSGQYSIFSDTTRLSCSK